jgi:hypothetical protein
MSEIVVGWKLGGVPNARQEVIQEFRENCSLSKVKNEVQKLGGDGSRTDLWKAEATNVLNSSVRDNDAT